MQPINYNGQSGFYTEIEGGRLPDPGNPWSYPTVAAVGPRGQFVVRHLEPGKTGEMGDVPIRTIDGHPVLSPRYRAAGWCMYEDLCRGLVRGVPDDFLAWERWRNLIRMRRENRHIPTGKLGLDFFHPEVAARRKREGDGAVPDLTLADMRELFPGVEIGDEIGDGERGQDH